MGSSSSGILAYGYDMGEDFGFDWKAPKPKWFGETDDDDETDEVETDEGIDDPGGDLGERALRVLLAAKGFTETRWDVEGYHARKRAAEKALGVKLQDYGSEHCCTYILAAIVHEIDDYGAKRVDPVVPDDADARLAWAIEVLGLTVTEPPGWILASSYG